MEITWYGTANLKVRNEDTEIHFDPYISGGVSSGRCTGWSCNLAEDIFITHGHFDHLMDVPELVYGGNYRINCSDTAAESLLSHSVDPLKINVIHPGQQINTGSMVVNVIRGRHSKAGLKLFLKTFLSPGAVFHPSALMKLLSVHRSFPCGEVFAYHIVSGEFDIFHIGSMEIDDDTVYPYDVDLLMLPYQGCSDLEGQAVKIIKRIAPRSVLLHHFNDSFPPVSRNIDTSCFVEMMKQRFPDVRVYVPEYGRTLAISNNLQASISIV
jgi:L-ascorbate metabolism protein UlaG (beta-lactamase superfamily)